MHVLVTRAEPAASRTARKLENAGLKPVSLPLFGLVDTGNPMPTGDAEHIIFTSANAAEILEQRGWYNTNPSATAYCVGGQTANAAKRLGFEKALTASGGGAALCREIAKLALPPGTRFLYPTTPDRSFDMQSELERIGHSTETIEVYKTEKIFPAPEKIENCIEACQNGAITVYSARSGDHLAQCLKDADQISQLKSISLIGISKTAINMMLNLPWRKVYVSQHPKEDGMIDMLGKVVANHSA